MSVTISLPLINVLSFALMAFPSSITVRTPPFLSISRTSGHGSFGSRLAFSWSTQIPASLGSIPCDASHSLDLRITSAIFPRSSVHSGDSSCVLSIVMRYCGDTMISKGATGSKSRRSPDITELSCGAGLAPTVTSTRGVQPPPLKSIAFLTLASSTCFQVGSLVSM